MQIEREREGAIGGEREKGKKRETETEMERVSACKLYTVDLIYNAIMSYLS